MAQDKEMSHEGITRDEEVEEQGLDIVLTGFEGELRMLEKWLEEPNNYVEVVKEIESKYEFKIPSNEIEIRLGGSLLKEKENVEVVEQENWEIEDIRQPSEEGKGMKTTITGMSNSIKRNRDTKDITGRKVKEKDKENFIKLGQCDPGKNTRIGCDEVMKVLKWTMEQENIRYVDLRIRQQVIRERMPTGKGSKINDGVIMSSTQDRKDEYEFDWTKSRGLNHNQQSEEEHMVPQDVMKIVDYMCLVERKEDYQFVWIVIFMAVNEIWNMVMFVLSENTNKGNNSEMEVFNLPQRIMDKAIKCC